MGGGEQLKLLPTAVTAATLTLTSQYCAHQASRRCHSHVPKLEDYIVRMGNKRSTTTQYSRKSEPFYFILEKKKKCKRIGSEIRQLRAFKYSECTFGASQKNKNKKSCRQELL